MRGVEKEGEILIGRGLRPLCAHHFRFTSRNSRKDQRQVRSRRNEAQSGVNITDHSSKHLQHFAFSFTSHLDQFLCPEDLANLLCLQLLKLRSYSAAKAYMKMALSDHVFACSSASSIRFVPKWNCWDWSQQENRRRFKPFIWRGGAQKYLGRDSFNKRRQLRSLTSNVRPNMVVPRHEKRIWEAKWKIQKKEYRKWNRKKWKILYEKGKIKSEVKKNWNRKD